MNNRHHFEARFQRGGMEQGRGYNHHRQGRGGEGHGPRSGRGGFDTMEYRPGRDEGSFDTLPFRPGYDEGDFGTLPYRPGEDEGGFDTLPRHPGEDGFPGPFGRGGEPGPDGFGRRGGRGPHGHRRPPFGQGPHLDGEGLEGRIDEAGLPELLELAGRMSQRRPGGGTARGQALVLSILAGRECMSQRELQQLLGIQPGSLSELLGKLEKKALITRERDEDRRGNLLRITDAGRAALPTGQEEEDPDGELFSALTQEQRASLRDILRLLLKDWAGRLAPRRERREHTEQV